MTSNLSRWAAEIIETQRARIEALEAENFTLRCNAVDMANELHPMPEPDGLEHVTLSRRVS